MTTVVTALPYFKETACSVAEGLGGTFVPYHHNLFTEIFRTADRIIAIMAIGIVIRGIAPLLKDKWEDPAVVVISPDFRYAIPVLGGHHGANTLSEELAARFGLEAVITTATESRGKEAVEVIAAKEGLRIINKDSTRKANSAILTGDASIYRTTHAGMIITGPDVSILVSDKPYSIGIGCRLGTTADEIVEAINRALEDAGISQDEIGIYASSRIKSHETGLIQAIRSMKAPLIFLNDSDLNTAGAKTSSAAERFGIAGVAEPACLAVSEKKELILGKQVYGNVTIAISK